MRRSISLLFALLTLSTEVFSAEEVRNPAVAGTFYTNEPGKLVPMIDGFIEEAQLPADAQGSIVAMIVPHAGFVYSGPTAGHAYKLLRQHPVDTVVLVGPFHKGTMEGQASVWLGGDWITPLGAVKVDKELAAKIAGESPSFKFDPSVHAGEHSLETQLPFLQRILPQAKIVPILISDPSAGTVAALAAALHKNLQGRNAVLLASSDLSHYYPETTAHRIDRHTLDLLRKTDAEGIRRSHGNRSSEMCGHAAVQTALEYARLNGEHTLQTLHYSTSADTVGSDDRVVGYLAAVVWKGKKDVASPDRPLDAAQQKKLLDLSRKTVEAHVQGRPLPGLDTDDPMLKEPRAVFITIRKDGQLRGCIGRILAEEPLIAAVKNMAVQSATTDPRFPPVEKEELKELTYEVSVLSPPMRVGSASEIEIGKHGVMVRQYRQSGVFLPKVAEHFDNDKEKFLDELCSQKARLPVSCWQDPATEIDVFTAQEFSEA